MTVYIHFHVRAGKPAERLHNVASVEDQGADTIRVRMQFADGARTFTEVSHVAVTPARDE